MTTSRRRLYLLRHAKSSRDAVGLPDRDRPLAPRGRRAVAALRQHFLDAGLHVDLVLCSPAQRTRDTWAGVAGGLASEPRVDFVEEIYDATVGELLTVVREVDPDVEALLLIGHNPGFEHLAHKLADTGDEAALTRLRDGYPTAAFATLSIDGPWSHVGRGNAQLTDFVRPRDLGAQ